MFSLSLGPLFLESEEAWFLTSEESKVLSLLLVSDLVFLASLSEELAFLTSVVFEFSVDDF